MHVQGHVPHLVNCAPCGRPESSYDVDVRTLERSYRGLQSKLHPDKFAMGSQVPVPHMPKTWHA